MAKPAEMSYNDYYDNVMHMMCSGYSWTTYLDLTYVPDPHDPEGLRGIFVGIRIHKGANPFGCQMT